MIDPRTVMVAIPTYSQRVVAEALGSLVASARLFAAISLTQGVAHVAMARNIVVEKFLRSGLDWLVTIDDDIAFTPADFQILMEPMQAFDYATNESEPAGDHPTRTRCKGFAGETHLPAMIDADAIVCAEYSYKSEEHTSELQSHSDLVC